MKRKSSDRNLAGRADIDRLDRGMRIRRAQKIGLGLTRAIDIAGVVALAGDETEVFLAAHSCAHARGGHSVFSTSSGMQDEAASMATLLPPANALSPKDRAGSQQIRRATRLLE